MKRLIPVLAMVFLAATLYAGDGAHCDMSKHKAKNVSLTGKVVCSDGECEKAVFRVADSDESYDVCHKSKAALKDLGAKGATVQIKGKLVNCSDSEKTELMIEDAKTI
jgi:hypothetical protein